MITKNNNATEEEAFDGATFEYELQKARITKIIENALYRLKLLAHLPAILENDGAILRKFLNKTEADFVMLVCEEDVPFSRLTVEDRSDLDLICNMLDRINMFEGRESASMKKGRGFHSGDTLDIYVAYVVDIIFKCKPLVSCLDAIDEEPESVMAGFIDSMTQLQKIGAERLNMSAKEESQRENDLKTAYRLSMMLSNNIEELEDLLEKQHQELSKEYDRKEAILQDLEEKVETLKEKCKNDIDKIIYDSEVTMMRNYNKSMELQEELSQEAKQSTQQYDSLLEDHLQQEKGLRAKRLKVEAQLASWVSKYDTDIGEKQAEYDELEKTYNQEKEELDVLQEKFDIQEEEYLRLMKEKEAEEQEIMNEKAWIFLQNRSARRIQRAWNAYRARRLAKKKGRKSKKKGDKGGSAGGKSKKSPKGAKKEEGTTLKGGPDPTALLEGKFGDAIMGEIKTKDAFDKKDVVVEL